MEEEVDKAFNLAYDKLKKDIPRDELLEGAYKLFFIAGYGAGGQAGIAKLAEAFATINSTSSQVSG